MAYSFLSDSLPFASDYNDHFQTPLIAYQHLSPVLLAAIHASSSSPRRKYTVYDPYYCTGSVPELLYSAFPKTLPSISQSLCCINLPRDFYKDIDDHHIPKCDFIVTNPPYSGDHKVRCFRYLVDRLTGSSFYSSAGQSTSTLSSPTSESLIDGYAVLLPSYCAGKAYYSSLMTQSKMRQCSSDTHGNNSDYVELFLIPPPSLRYAYDHPEGTGKNTPPFFSIWYIGLKRSLLGSVRSHIDEYNSRAKQRGDHEIRLVEEFSELRQLADTGDSAKSKAGNAFSSVPSLATSSSLSSKSPSADSNSKKRKIFSNTPSSSTSFLSSSSSSFHQSAAASNLSQSSAGGGFGFAKRKNPRARRKMKERMMMTMGMNSGADDKPITSKNSNSSHASQSKQPKPLPTFSSKDGGEIIWTKRRK